MFRVHSGSYRALLLFVEGWCWWVCIFIRWGDQTLGDVCLDCVGCVCGFQLAYVDLRRVGFWGGIGMWEWYD